MCWELCKSCVWKDIKIKRFDDDWLRKKEAESRHTFTMDILYHFFAEENVPEWTKYLDQYLKEKK